MYEDQTKDIKGYWFKEDHVAKHSIYKNDDGNELEEIVWGKKDGSSIYRVIYLLDKRRGNLIITGDIGDAVYCWYCSIKDFQFFKDMDISYFASKCLSSEHGRGYRVWDPDSARKSIRDHFKSQYDCLSEEELIEFTDKYGTKEKKEGETESVEDSDEVNVMNVDEYVEKSFQLLVEEHWDEIFGSEYGFYNFLHDEFEEFGDLIYCNNLGKVIDMRCLGHLIGLQMAIKQLGIGE